MRRVQTALSIIFWILCGAPAAVSHANRIEEELPSPAFVGTGFTNPIVAAQSPAGSADPSVVFKDGLYYYCRSLDDRAIGVAVARRLQDIGKAPMVTVWTPASGTAHSSHVWAPELQYLQGRWYIYFTASDSDNANHRMFVLQGSANDPQQSFSFKGKISASVDTWAIDGIAFEKDGGLYFVWSGWRGATDGFPQVTYIASMRDPWTIAGDRHEIASPDLPWEQRGAKLQEGPAVLRRGGTIFLTYSASASWSNDYVLGMLTYSGGDILQRSSWSKSALPVFSMRAAGGAFGPGHNSFVKSPDGKEDWIVYHAIDRDAGGWSQRSVRAQRVGWSADGTPDFGTPVAPGLRISAPSGTIEATTLGQL